MTVRAPGSKSGQWLAVVGILLLLAGGGGWAYWHVNLSPVGNQSPSLSRIFIQTETPASYLEDPSSLSADFTSNYTRVDFEPEKDFVYDLKFSGSTRKPVIVEDIDLRIFMPRVSPIVEGNSFLTRLALKQRELNRNDTLFPAALPGGDDFNLSNNCLREGLWEVYFSRPEGDDQGKYYHGWFNFPAPLYRKLCKEVNGFDLKPYEPALEHYLRLDGTPVNLSHLRKVVSEREVAVAEIELHLNDRILHFAEQQHKAKLVINSNLETYADIAKPENQPVKMMQFAEPGRYKEKNLMKFDYTFLQKPEKMILREVKNDRLAEKFCELEVTFPAGEKNVWVKNWPFMRRRDGLKLILGGWKLEDIPVATQKPVPASDFAHFTFGFGTPEIYSTYNQRLKDFPEPSNYYLIMVDKDDRYVDNHTLGLDQVYVVRLPEGSIMIYLVSYERIMLLAQWNLNLPGLAETCLAESPPGCSGEESAKAIKTSGGNNPE